MRNILLQLLCTFLVCILSIPLFAQNVSQEPIPQLLNDINSAVKSQKKAADTANFEAADNYYGPSFGRAVYAMHTSGKEIVVGGVFDYLGTQQVNRIARWDGNEWSSMDSGLNGSVVKLKEINDTLFAVGFFNETGDGRPMNHVARWTGEKWEELSGQIPNNAYSLAFDGSNYFIGTATGVYLVDGDHIEQIAATDAYVDHLVFHNDTLYAGGPFTQLDGNPVNYVAGWHKGEWEPVGSGLNSVVRAMTVYQDKLTIGGFFFPDEDSELNRVASLNGNEWEPVGDFAEASGGLLSMSARDNKLFVGGNILGDDIERAAYFDGSDWHQLGTASLTVWHVHESEDETAYIGGDFASAGIDNSMWTFKVEDSQTTTLPGIPVETGGNNLTGSVYGIASSDDGTVGVAGIFGDSGPDWAYHFSLFENGQWTAKGDYNGSMATILWHEENWFVGGYFTEINGSEYYHVARFDGNEWHTLGAGLNSPVTYLTVHNNEIYAFGPITSTADESVTLNGIARWDGSEWQSIGETPQGYIFTGFSFDGDLYVGGDFQFVDDIEVNRIARWDGSEWHAVGSGFNRPVRALNEYQGQLIAGGNFSISGESETGSIATFDGNDWSWHDSGFSGTVHDLAVVDDEHLFAAGGFRGVENEEISNLAYWNGSEWQPAGNPNGTVSALEPNQNGGLYISGYFDSFFDVPSFCFGELNGISPSTSIAENGGVPERIQLNQNYPNPFNPTTEISYELPEAVEVTLQVFDMLGRHVTTLVDQPQNAGTQSIRFDASKLSSGIYIYRIEAGNFVQTRKMLLIK